MRGTAILARKPLELRPRICILEKFAIMAAISRNSSSMNRTIASFSVGAAFALAVASGFLFTSSSLSTGQSNIGMVEPESAQPTEGVSESVNSKPSQLNFLNEENFVTIPAGSFITSDDKEVHVDEFNISQYEVSNREWRAFIGSDRSEVASYGDDPVTNKTLQEITNFIEALNSSTIQTYRLPNQFEYELLFSRSNRPQDCNRDIFGGDGCGQSQLKNVGSGIQDENGLFNFYGNASEFVTMVNRHLENVNDNGYCQDGAIIGRNFESKPSHDDIVSEKFYCIENTQEVTKVSFRLMRENKNADH